MGFEEILGDKKMGEASQQLRWNIKKFVETNDRFEFHFEDNEDAEEFQSFLRDSGFKAVNDPNIKPDWALVVEKESVMYSFIHEFGILTSPRKFIDRSAKITHSQAMQLLTKSKGIIEDTLDNTHECMLPDLVDLLEELEKVFD